MKLRKHERLNVRDFCITDKAGNYIEDIDEAINYSVEENRNCYQFGKVKSFKYKITAECEYKRDLKKKLKSRNCSSTRSILLTRLYMITVTSNND